MAYQPQSDAGAFEIRASGVGCEVARDLARSAEGASLRFAEDGFACEGRRVDRGLPATRYTCKRDGARVTFEVS